MFLEQNIRNLSPGLCTLITHGQGTWTALGVSVFHPNAFLFSLCPPNTFHRSCSDSFHHFSAPFVLNFTDLIFFILVEPGEQ